MNIEIGKKPVSYYDAVWGDTKDLDYFIGFFGDAYGVVIRSRIEGGYVDFTLVATTYEGYRDSWYAADATVPGEKMQEVIDVMNEALDWAKQNCDRLEFGWKLK